MKYTAVYEHSDRNYLKDKVSSSAKQLKFMSTYVNCLT